jgi:hypothetical protein
MIKLFEKKLSPLEHYYVVAYPNKSMMNVINNLMTDDFEDVIDFIDEHTSNGEYIVVKNNITNQSKDSDGYYDKLNMYLDDDQVDVSFDIIYDVFGELE